VKRGTRILLAALVSPLAVLIPLALFAAAEPFDFPNIKYGLRIWFLVALFAVPIGYIAVGTLGLGAHFLFERLGIRGTWPYVIFGSVVSLVPGAIILLSNPTGDDRIYPVLFFTCAIAASVAFGVIVKTPLKETE
jgi:hypothetical protein